MRWNHWSLTYYKSLCLTIRSSVWRHLGHIRPRKQCTMSSKFTRYFLKVILLTVLFISIATSSFVQWNRTSLVFIVITSRQNIFKLVMCTTSDRSYNWRKWSTQVPSDSFNETRCCYTYEKYSNTFDCHKYTWTQKIPWVLQIFKSLFNHSVCAWPELSQFRGGFCIMTFRFIFSFKTALPVGELNPGLPRDRRGYSPLY